MANGSILKLNAPFMFNGLNRSTRDVLRVVVLFTFVLLALPFAGAARAADDFLDPDVAFKFSASEQPGEVVVHYKIADGYYMYRRRSSSGQQLRPEIGRAHV